METNTGYGMDQKQKIYGRFFVVLLIVMSVLSCKNDTVSKNRIKEAVFTGVKTKYVYSVKDFGLPSDWENSKYMELEMRLSSPESIGLSLFTGRGETGISVRPASNGWIKLEIPLV